MSSKPEKMIYKIKTHTKNYTIIDRTCLTDRGLSPYGIWLLLYCLSKPETWNIVGSSIVKETGYGKFVVRNAIHELEDAGYIHTVPFRKPNGTIMYKRYVRETPGMSAKAFDTYAEPNVANRDRSTANGPTVSGATVNGEVDDKREAKRPERSEMTREEGNDNDAAVGIVNQFPGHCTRCDLLVEAGDGILIGKTPAHRTEIECAAAATKKRDWQRSTSQTSSTYDESAGESWEEYRR